MEILYNEKLEITPENLFELIEKTAKGAWAFVPELSDEGISFFKIDREIEIVNGEDNLKGETLGAIKVVPLTSFASRVFIFAENNETSYDFMRMVGGDICRIVMGKDPFSERFREEAAEKLKDSLENIDDLRRDLHAIENGDEESIPSLADKAKRKRGPSQDKLKDCEAAMEEWLDGFKTITQACDDHYIVAKTLKKWIPTILDIVDETTRTRWITRIKILGMEHKLGKYKEV